MNKQKEKGIDWCDYTWSPVTGCNNNCHYCYARRIYNRFRMDFTPTFHEDRLKQPYSFINKKVKIFVCGTADLLGEWVNRNWIERIINVVKNVPSCTFQFLTKNPKRYKEFDFPNNCWLGATITGIEKSAIDVHYGIRELKRKNNFKFISFEPLLNKIDMDLSNIDLVVIGAMTGSNSIKPQKEWIYSIQHPNILYKNNIKKFL